MRRVCCASTRSMSIWRGLANASRIADSVISLKVTRCCLSLADVGGLGDVPGDRLALAIEVGGEEDDVGRLGRLGDLGDLLAAVVGDHVLGFEVVVDVDAELALARVLGQVADVAVGRQDPVVGAEIALDRAGLGRRFDDDEVLGHGRECSTGSLPRPWPGLDQTSRMRRRKSSSISRSGSGSGSGGARVAMPGAVSSIGRRRWSRATSRHRPSPPAGSRRTGCGGTGRRRST